MTNRQVHRHCSFEVEVFEIVSRVPNDVELDGGHVDYHEVPQKSSSKNNLDSMYQVSTIFCSLILIWTTLTSTVILSSAFLISNPLTKYWVSSVGPKYC